MRELRGYQLIEKIGTGGFGEVYKAYHPPIDRTVAIKVILPEKASEPDFIQRFEIEAQLVARLEHPHIVPLYDYWREPNSAYLVMRFLRAGSLRDHIDEHGAMDAVQVRQMISQIAAALTFAHRNGVIHRDLKSDNILLDESNNFYLTDFGIAKDLGADQDLTKDNILGTPAYLSPEQIRGETASPQSDVYALGILAYEALTGSKPFIDHSPATLLYKQLNDPLPDITDTRPDLPLELNDILQRATAKDSSLRYDTALEFARAFQTALSGVTSTMPDLGGGTVNVMSLTQVEQDIFQPKNPYKGLRAFQQADADEFFGRDELIERLLKRMSVRGSDDDFLAIVGPSGSGKSSVVKAGLLPHIKDSALNDERDWYTIDMVPGTHPMEELEAGFLSIAPREIPGLLEKLRADERGIVRVVKQILPDDNAEVVLFIDQFEEVFTLIEDEAARAHFLDSVMAAVQDERSRLKIIITIRADFYDKPLLYAKFGELIRQKTELVLPLNEDELREAIIGPAERVGMVLEPGLIEAILTDVYEQPGALPLLQYALTELFERREGRKMTLKAYQEIGGTAGALARRAEELYQSFDDETREATRQMFLRLVTLGEGTEDTRRRVMQSELYALGAYRDAMEMVIEMFGKYRLLTFDNDPQTRSSTVEVAHEALIRQWERVQNWLDENREALRAHRRLTQATDEWLHAQKDPSYLARGTRLQQWEEWEDNTDIAMTTDEQEYLKASVESREARLAEERAQQEREDNLRRRARNLLGVVAAIMTIAAIAGFGLALVAVNARGEAERGESAAATAAAIAEENEAEARALALAANARNALAANDPQLALVLAIQAVQVYDPVPTEALRTLANTTYSEGPRYRYTAHEGSVLDVHFSADGLYAVSGSVDGTVRLFNNGTGDEVLSVTADSEDTRFNSVAMHPNNNSFAAAASDGNLYVWSFPDGELLHTLEGHEGEVLSVVYSPDGLFLASGGADHTIRLWGASSGLETRLIEGHTGTVYQVTFSPDGSRLVSSSGDATLLDTGTDDEDRTVRIWDTQTGEQLQLIDPESGFVRALDYSPDGETIAYGVWDNTNAGTVRIHSAETGEEIRRFFAHTTPLTDVVYSPDADQIVSVAWDRNVRIWNIDRGVEEQAFSGFAERILAMDYSPDEQFLLLGLGNIGNNEFQDDEAIDSSIWLWDVTNRDEIDVYRDHTDWVWTVDISPDGTLAASAGGPLRLPEVPPGEAFEPIDSGVHIWNAATSERVALLRGHTNTVDSVKFLPDNERILSAAWDGNIILWDIESEEREQLYRDHEGRVYMLEVFDDGERFLSAGTDGIVRLWDTESGDVLQTFEALNNDGDPVALYSVMLNPDETLIAVGGGDGVIRIYDIESGATVQTLRGHTSWVQEARFHPDGQRLVSTSWDGTVRLWDTESGRELRQFTGHNGHTFGTAFSDDGQLLMTTSEDTTVRLWEVASGEELHRYQHVDWVQEVLFSPDETFAISGGQDNTARVWRVDRTASELVDFARDIRFIRDLTCAEREVYRLEPCPATE